MSTPEAHVYLVRHSESVANTNPRIVGGRTNESPLTVPRGIAQSQDLGKFMLRHQLKPDYAYTSPAIRTQVTASISLAVAGLALKPVIEDDLQELSQGDWTGQDRSLVYTPEVLSQIAEQGKDFKAPGGESMSEVGIRARNALNDIVEQCKDEKNDGETPVIMVFTHGLLIRCLASLEYDWSHEKTFTTEIPNASLTYLAPSAGQWNLEYLGLETTH